ncbi:MAG: DNA methyltransferase [Vampirovibrionales bacterium]
MMRLKARQRMAHETHDTSSCVHEDDALQALQEKADLLAQGHTRLIEKAPRPHAGKGTRRVDEQKQAKKDAVKGVLRVTAPSFEPLGTQDIRVRRTKTAHKRFPCQRVSELDPRAWRELSGDLLLGSLWLFQGRSREDGHRNSYHGNCIPQIIYQLLRRYTRTGDTILDCFLGSGTSLIEAYRLGRFGLGLELQPSVAEETQHYLTGLGASETLWKVACGNSQDAHWVKQRVAQFLEPLVPYQQPERPLATGRTNKKASQAFTPPSFVDFLFLHPPYDDIIKFSEHPDDLSAQSSTQDFLEAFDAVLRASVPVLKPGGFASIVIGDKYTAGTWLPLGFWCMNLALQHGLSLKAIIVKNMTGNERGKGKTGNLWKYRAVAGGFYLFEHEYVFILEKPLLKS